MRITPPAIEREWNNQQAAVVTALGAINPSCTPVIVPRQDSVLLLTGGLYPINHGMGILTVADIDAYEQVFRAHNLPATFEFAPAHTEPALLDALRARGYAHQLNHVVMLCQPAQLPITQAAANLQWIAAERVPLPAHPTPETCLRIASYRRPQAVCINVLHAQGVIASAGIVVREQVAHCFGAWVDPAFRRAGHYHTLIQSRLAFAQDNDCHSMVMQVKPHGAAYHTALQWGFVVWYERQRWVKTH